MLSRIAANNWTVAAPTTQDSWVCQHQNVCALAEKACQDGFTAGYTRAPQLFRDLALARADGSLRSLLARLAKIDAHLVDDWVMAALADAER